MRANPGIALARVPASAGPGGREGALPGSIGLDREGHIESVSVAAQQLLGWAHEELVGKPVIALTGVGSGEALAHATSMLRALRERRQLRLVETRFRRRDGAQATVTCTALPRNDGSGGMTLAFAPLCAA